MSPIDRLRIPDLPDDPMELFGAWHRLAREHPAIRYPGAMCLSTVSPDGLPEGRYVIIESFDEGAFVFLTDARSPKVRAITHHDLAALTAYWEPLELQVRVSGTVRQQPDQVADEIFRRRPRRSQTTPWVSRQSRATTLVDLETGLESLDVRWRDRDSLPRPDHWRAYGIHPETLEFWVARTRRLHDRILYRREANGAWSRIRLAP